jgi:Uma2 family endonuclease
MPVQLEHGRVVNALGHWITSHLGSPDRADMGPEIGYITARDPDTVRAPDWSLIWPEEARARREGAWIAGGPNLAVEVVSPDDTWAEVQDKVDEYLDAGTQLVWVIYPDRRTVHVIRPDAPTKILRPGDVLTGEPVLPGFALAVDQLLPPPAEGQPSAE